MALHIGVNLDGLADFSSRHQVAELALFGSCLREDFGPESDIDILVTFKPEAKVSLFDLVDMAEELSLLFGRHVDLVPKAGLKSRIRRSVLESSRVIYDAAA